MNERWPRHDMEFLGGRRQRRLRRTGWMRDMVRETTLTPHDFIWPLFIIDGQNEKTEIRTMPGVERLSVDLAVKAAKAAHAEGRVKVAAIRSPDFYGPGVEQSALGSASLMPLAKGNRAVMLGDVDLPHDVAHVSDYARAVITLRDADDDAYGEAWHVPCAPTLTLRQHLQIAADAVGVKLKLTVLPRWLAPIIGAFVPFVQEGVEMQFLFDRPYVVKADKFRARFWSDVTPFETGLGEAASYFRAAA